MELARLRGICNALNRYSADQLFFQEFSLPFSAIFSQQTQQEDAAALKAVLDEIGKVAQKLNIRFAGGERIEALEQVENCQLALTNTADPHAGIGNECSSGFGCKQKSVDASIANNVTNIHILMQPIMKT